jgi:iron complex outermembrane receptor protein
MFSDRWKTGFGEIGALIDLAYLGKRTRTTPSRSSPTTRAPTSTGQDRLGAEGLAVAHAELRPQARRHLRRASSGRRCATELLAHLLQVALQDGWDEQAMLSQETSDRPYNIQVAATASYDAKGAC